MPRACASCHHEGRADGLSWRIDDRLLQIPILAGRTPSTAPYGWDGHAKNLPASLRSTFRRLNGLGSETARPSRRISKRCRPCGGRHDGAAYIDQARHRLSPSQTAVDTPSLLGLAASAPYFHDGSAATLEVLLRDRGAVHGMSDAARTLTDRETPDLTAFLESL